MKHILLHNLRKTLDIDFSLTFIHCSEVQAPNFTTTVTLSCMEIYYTLQALHTLFWHLDYECQFMLVVQVKVNASGSRQGYDEFWLFLDLRETLDTGFSLIFITWF